MESSSEVYEMSDAALISFLLKMFAEDFIKMCAHDIQWENLSGDVIMEIGCGSELLCCKAILKLFPGVKTLIEVNESMTAFRRRTVRDRRVGFHTGSVLKRSSLQFFEGKMNKVITTTTYHRYKKVFPGTEIEVTFLNVYLLLKPGGEAAFFFCLDSNMYQFVMAMLEVPKFKAVFKGPYIENLYVDDRKKRFYEDVLKTVGYINIRKVVEERYFTFPSDEKCKEALFNLFKDEFKVPLEIIEVFKDEAFRIFERTFGRHEGQLRYKTLILAFFGGKPNVNSNPMST